MEQRPFRKIPFLYRMLATIFLVESGFLAFAFMKCSVSIPGQTVPMVSERCPKLGERAETLFVAAVSTTLALLSSVEQNPYPDGKLALSKKVVKKKPEEGTNPYKED